MMPGISTRLCCTILVGLLTGLLTGCSTLGPSAITSGRLAYNEAVAETDRQQILMAVLNNRYQQQGSLLAVSSITASLSFSVNGGVQAGTGDSAGYAGNLVPLSAGLAYEENPTISYTPIGGEQYLRRMMSPLPIALLARLSASMTEPAVVYEILVAAMNGVRNPLFHDSASASIDAVSKNNTDARFQRVVALMVSLARNQVLRWVKDPGHPGGFALSIAYYAPQFSAEVGELMALLGLDIPHKPGTSLVIPVTTAVGANRNQAIALRTRSLYQLGELLSAAVELPVADQRPGVARRYPPSGLLGSRLHIHWSETRPQRAAVAVYYRRGWFYIADDDANTKGYFLFLTAMWSVTIAEAASGASAPVLTVPVGGS